MHNKLYRNQKNNDMRSITQDYLCLGFGIESRNLSNIVLAQDLVLFK